MTRCGPMVPLVNVRDHMHSEMDLIYVAAEYGMESLLL